MSIVDTIVDVAQTVPIVVMVVVAVMMNVCARRRSSGQAKLELVATGCKDTSSLASNSQTYWSIEPCPFSQYAQHAVPNALPMHVWRTPGAKEGALHMAGVTCGKVPLMLNVPSAPHSTTVGPELDVKPGELLTVQVSPIVLPPQSWEIPLLSSCTTSHARATHTGGTASPPSAATKMVPVQVSNTGGPTISYPGAQKARQICRNDLPWQVCSKDGSEKPSCAFKGVHSLGWHLRSLGLNDPSLLHMLALDIITAS